MPKLFDRNGQSSEYSWQKGDALNPEQPTLLTATVPNIIEVVASADERVGLWFEPEDEPETLPPDVYAMVSTIAVNFPKFTDGRGFSIGKLLRQRWGFQGDLIAVGDVLVDQIAYLHRCGFSHTLLPEHTSAETFQRCAHPFTHAYQTV